MVALALLVALVDPASAGTSVEVYTMGPGDDLFSRFGHAAICVVDDASPQGRCYNYGTADFTTPVPLSVDVLRGRAEFWVSVTPLPRMLRVYEGYDRTVWRQVLPLDEPAAAQLARALARDALPENRTYIYDHLTDNCATRVRDHVDAATDGALDHDDPFPVTLRDLVRAGLGHAGMQAASDLALGRRLDRFPTYSEAMFLPAVLRAEIELRLGVAPEVISTRRADEPAATDPSIGRALGLAGALGVGGVAGLALRASVQRRRRVFALPATAVVGGLGALLWALAAVSVVPELRLNEALLWLWPTDLAIAAMPAAVCARYLKVRAAALALLAGLAAAGALVQPPTAAVLALAALVPGALARPAVDQAASASRTRS